MSLETVEIKERVHQLYWNDDANCAITTVTVLSEYFGLPVNKQIKDGLMAMPGLGKNGLTCGIVIASLMFHGILVNEKNINMDIAKGQANQLVVEFKDRFGSEICSVLRPEGFISNNPPHLCEQLTVEAIEYVIDFIDKECILDKDD